MRAFINWIRGLSCNGVLQLFERDNMIDYYKDYCLYMHAAIDDSSVLVSYINWYTNDPANIDSVLLDHLYKMKDYGGLGYVPIKGYVVRG